VVPKHSDEGTLAKRGGEDRCVALLISVSSGTVRYQQSVLYSPFSYVNVF